MGDVPVIESAAVPRLLGMVSRADVISAYNRAVATIGSIHTPLRLKRVDPEGSERDRIGYTRQVAAARQLQLA